MKNMWDIRYAQEEYVYGIEPNKFLVEELEKLRPSKILFPAEGEGRNAVYAAKKGWKVSAFDSSIEAKKKAEKLAKKNKVSIDYHQKDFETINFELNSFDFIALIYAHSQKREQNHKRLIQFLKPGGIIILEGFSKNQINYTTGGPKSLELLFSEEELKNDFNSLSELKIWKKNIQLSEGEHHKGEASIIRLIGVK